MTIPPYPAPTPGDPNLPGPGLTPEERNDVKTDEAQEVSAWAPSEPGDAPDDDAEVSDE